MDKILDAILLVFPIMLFLYEYIRYTVYKFKYGIDKYNNSLWKYLYNYDDLLFAFAIIIIVIWAFGVIANIVYICFSYTYQVIRFYTSNEFVITTLLIIIFYTALIVFKIGGGRVFLYLRSTKLQKKINVINDKINLVKNINGNNLDKEDSIDFLEKSKEKYTKELIYITTSYKCDKIDKKELKKKLFEQK